MENKRFEHIITRYLKGKATPEEEAELLQAIHASKEWEAAFRGQRIFLVGKLSFKRIA